MSYGLIYQTGVVTRDTLCIKFSALGTIQTATGFSCHDTPGMQVQ